MANKLQIKMMDKNAIDLLCSGQVIVSLENAIKELFENALDAGAKSIRVTFRDHGKTSIEVSDDGHGIMESDFEMLAKPYNTSKLIEFDDLKSMSTYGFRGEALHSISALSKMSIITRHANAVSGYKLDFDENGNISAKVACPRVVGTTVIIREIYYNYPVRRKCLYGSFKRDFAKAIQLLTSYACCCLNVAIICTNTIGSKKVELLNKPKGLTVKENILHLFGLKQLSLLVEFNGSEISDEIKTELEVNDEDIKNLNITVNGFISKREAGCGRSINDKHFFFINSRPFDHPKLSKFINEIYHLVSTQYPFIVLFIEYPKNLVDVNVTPDKRSVFISKEICLFGILKTCLLKLYDHKSEELNCGILSSQLSQSSIRSNIQNSSGSENESEDEISNVNHGQPLAKIARCSSPCDDSFLKKSDDNSFFNLGSSMNSTDKSSESDEDSVVLIQNRNFKPVKNNEHLVIHQNKFLKRFESNEKPKPQKRKMKQSSEPESGKQRTIKEILINNVEQLIKNSDHSNSKADTENTSNNENDNESPKLIDSQVENLNSAIPPKNSSKEAYINDISEISIISWNKPENDVIRRIIKLDTNLEKIREGFKTLQNVDTESSYHPQFVAKISQSQNENAEEELQKQLHKNAFLDMKIIGQFNKSFIITKLESDLFIIDQHATDERYNFEDLISSTVLEPINLLTPLPINLTAYQESILMENIDIFSKNGFKFNCVETSSPGKKVMLTGVPSNQDWIAGKKEIEEILFAIMDSPHKATNFRPTKVEEMLASRACRKSVMIGDDLTFSKMKTIVNHMAQNVNPWHCAHKRPTIRHLFNLNNCNQNFLVDL